jgi:flavorubredoxin
MCSSFSFDYLVAHHAEQDHSGAIPEVLKKYPNAQVVTTPKGGGMLADLLGVQEEKIKTVQDGETLSLGDRTVEFIYTPWVHWPETMSSYLVEDHILFTGDFFGSHVATTYLYVRDEPRVYEAAKRYYAEIMMPFRKVIQKNLEKITSRELELIATTHGPIYDQPLFIIEAYRDWVSDRPKNEVVLPYVSMHGSTKKMVEYLVSALTQRGVTVHQFDLAQTDIGKLAITLVDAATIVIGTPTVLLGAHPAVLYASSLANLIRPKLQFASIIGSFGWNSKAVDQIASLIPNLKVEILDPVLCKGYPKDNDLKKLDTLAEKIVEKHNTIGLC